MSAADPLGFDVWVRTDADPSGRSASGIELVENAILHRITTALIPLVEAQDGFVEYGEDVRSWVGETTTAAKADAKGPRLALVLQRDPRLDPTTIRATVTIAPAGTTTPSGALVDLIVSIAATTTTGFPIALIVGVNSISVELLSQGA
jgi:hypothetical protein